MEFCKLNNCDGFFETSAKEGYNITEAFLEIGKKIFEYHLQNKYPNQNMFANKMTLSEKNTMRTDSEGKKCC